jgi:hypothetical protein
MYQYYDIHSVFVKFRLVRYFQITAMMLLFKKQKETIQEKMSENADVVFLDRKGFSARRCRPRLAQIARKNRL